MEEGKIYAPMAIPATAPLVRFMVLLGEEMGASAMIAAV